MTKLQQTQKQMGLLSVKEVSEILGISDTWLVDHKDRFPRKHTLQARTYYHIDDVPKIRAYLEMPKKSSASLRSESIMARGYFSIVQAAKAIGVPHVTLQVGINKGRVKLTPSHRIGTGWYYSRDDVEKLREVFDDRKRPEGVFVVREVAEMLGMSQSSLEYHIKRWRDLGGETWRGHRCFDEADVAEMKKRLDRKNRPDGCITSKEAAGCLGLSFTVFRTRYYSANLKGKFGVIVRGKLYFTETEFAQIRRALGLHPTPKMM